MAPSLQKARKEATRPQCTHWRTAAADLTVGGSRSVSAKAPFAVQRRHGRHGREQPWARHEHCVHGGPLCARSVHITGCTTTPKTRMWTACKAEAVKLKPSPLSSHHNHLLAVTGQGLAFQTGASNYSKCLDVIARNNSNRVRYGSCTGEQHRQPLAALILYLFIHRR